MNTEAIVTSVVVSNKNCIGCKNHNADVMITMLSGEVGSVQFNDYYLTTEQAEYLIQQLDKKLEENNQ